MILERERLVESLARSENETELAANDLNIVLDPPVQTTVRIVRELRIENLDQADTGLWQDITASLIVAFALFTSMDTTHGDDVRLIEVRDGHDMLSLAVFDNEFQIGPIRIDGQSNPESGRITRIAAQVIEFSLPD